MPNQGQWNEDDFFRLHTNRMAELAGGCLEVLPMPNWLHQLIVKFLTRAIEARAEAGKLGDVVLFAPLPVRLFPGTIREPDVLYVAPENIPRNASGYPERVDLVVEALSVYRNGEVATSRYLNGLCIAVADVLALREQNPDNDE